MTMDRWGDSTHRMSAYNHHHQPSSRDQRQIDRMERETMVLYPTLQPNPVLPMRSPGFSGGRGIFPRGTGGIRGLNWRAEGLRAPPPRNGLACLHPECEEGPSTSAAFYRQQRDAAPFVTRRKYNRKSPSRRPHRKVPYYPPSPQYKSCSTSEDEADQISAARGKYTDPTLTPIPRDEPANMKQEETGQEEDSPGYSTPQEAVGMTTQQKHTALSNQLDRALQEAQHQPGPSCLKKQGGGDREPTSGPQALKQGELNLAKETWFMEPNKVRFFDEPDTYRANVGRHRETQPRLMRAKTYPHLVFTDPPASPDREESKSPRERRAASNPPGEASKATPDSTTNLEEPSLEMPEAPPVPLEPEIVVVPYPGAPTPKEKDSDCEIVEPPMPFKPKKGWAKKRIEQTKKTLVLCIPRMDGPLSRERRLEPLRWKILLPHRQKEKTQEQVRHKSPNLTQGMGPWMNRTRHPPLIQ